MLKKAHEECYGDHDGGRALAKRLLRASYFWPSMKKDAMEHVQKCEKCQRHGPLIHIAGEAMTIIPSPCPFAQWGIDIVGPSPLAT